MTGDLKFSVRTLFNQPAFAMVAIITLSLGIGATTAVFSILNAVLLADLPYNDPGRLYMLRSLDAKGNPTALMAPRYVAPLLQGHPSVESGTFGWGLAGSVIAADGTPYPFLPYRVTPRFFDVFNQEIALGRGFQSNEPPASIVISYATWKNYFKSDPNIVGAAIRVDNSPRSIVGVVRESFEFPKGAQAWQPLYTGPPLDNLVNFEAYLRLRPGVTSKGFERACCALEAVGAPCTKRKTIHLRPPTAARRSGGRSRLNGSDSFWSNDDSAADWMPERRESASGSCESESARDWVARSCGRRTAAHHPPAFDGESAPLNDWRPSGCRVGVRWSPIDAEHRPGGSAAARWNHD